jgi:hypothetical protein
MCDPVDYRDLLEHKSRIRPFSGGVLKTILRLSKSVSMSALWVFHASQKRQYSRVLNIEHRSIELEKLGPMAHDVQENRHICCFKDDQKAGVN